MKPSRGIVLKFLVTFFLLFSPLLQAADFIIDKQTVLRVEQKYGKFAKNRVLSLVKLMNSLKGASDETKLVKVNNFFNQVRYQSDLKNWGVNDYWATPMEFMGKDKGDCEDYTIAKYFVLKRLGIPVKKMYLTYTKSLKYKVAHMVLTYHKSARSIPLVLDNYNLKILPATQRKDLIPVYSFNDDALFLSDKQGKGLTTKIPKGVEKNKKWSILVNNIRRNKI